MMSPTPDTHGWVSCHSIEMLPHVASNLFRNCYRNVNGKFRNCYRNATGNTNPVHREDQENLDWL